MPANTFQEEGTSFKRKLSKREKKMLKKQEKQNRIKNNENEENPAGVAGKLYTGTNRPAMSERFIARGVLTKLLR